MKIILPIATEAQIRYLEILFNDLKFDRTQRNAWLSDTTEREIHYLTDITKSEASKIIDMLKEMKEGRGE